MTVLSDFPFQNFTNLINAIQITIIGELHVVEENEFFISKQLNYQTNKSIFWMLQVVNVPPFEPFIVLLQDQTGQLDQGEVQDVVPFCACQILPDWLK